MPHAEAASFRERISQLLRAHFVQIPPVYFATLSNFCRITRVRERSKMSEAMEVDPKPSSSQKPSNMTPWVEKYRPQTFDEIVGNEDIVDKLRVFSESGNLPNILLSGPPGTGKTTTILCLARILLGAQMKNAVLELNASNERGIDVVREKIKGFAQSKVTLPANRQKIVILDEADSMTTGAQQALRRTMEIYSSTTRFALACNTSDKIIEPIQSRCAHVRFNKLTESQIKKRVLEICHHERVDYTEDGIKAILFTAQGDLRQAINNLQSTCDGFGKVDYENVFKVCDEPHPLVVKEILQCCVENKFDEAYKKFRSLWKMGYSAQDLISNIFNVCKGHDMSEALKLEFIKEIGIANLRMNKGVNSLLQFSGLLVRLCKKSQG